MATGTLTIDLEALRANWSALDAKTTCETAAVVKADGYGLGVKPVARALAEAGARHFFVAVAEEGQALREALGHGPEISIFSGHMEGDAALLRDFALTPMLNSPEQVARHRNLMPDHPYGIQLDTGMNRLGMEPSDWADIRGDLKQASLRLVMSHLACADEPDHWQNTKQLQAFCDMTHDVAAPRSLSATGGLLLGPDYHFDLTRPGIGLYGGAPFLDAQPVVRLSLPVVQTRTLDPGETVGYGASFEARKTAKIATISSGYADGLIRYMSNAAYLFANEKPCRLAGRVSMDLLTIDVTDLDEVPDHLDILCVHQGVDALAEAASTIGYEILTSLGPRYTRDYRGSDQ